MTILSNDWVLTVTSPVATRTAFYGKYTSLGQGPSWTYKQGTLIAQDFFWPTNGSYFGVNPVLGYPLFTWSGAPGHDCYPDPTRALQWGDTYGVNLHS